MTGSGVNIDLVLGPLIIGTVLNTFVYGICVLQFSTYWQFQKKDQLTIKCDFFFYYNRGECLKFNQTLSGLDLPLGYIPYMRAALHALGLCGPRIQQPNFPVDGFVALFINANRYNIVSSILLSVTCALP